MPLTCMPTLIIVHFGEGISLVPSCSPFKAKTRPGNEASEESVWYIYLIRWGCTFYNILANKQLLTINGVRVFAVRQSRLYSTPAHVCNHCSNSTSNSSNNCILAAALSPAAPKDCSVAITPPDTGGPRYDIANAAMDPAAIPPAPNPSTATISRAPKNAAIPPTIAPM